MADNQEVIVLGGGCFWCFDAAFKLVKGISKVEEGYSGGDVPNPTDEQIYYNDTGHAEVVRLTYDPKIITLEDILEIFWTLHDPTTSNGKALTSARSTVRSCSTKTIPKRR